MKNKIKIVAKILLFILLMHHNAIHAQNGCCGPCGEVITNLPMPSYDCNQVQPFQNFIATSLGYNNLCPWNGLYFGTGFGYGRLSLNLTIPGVIFPPQVSNNYITEFVSIGYAYSSSSCGFFIGTELGYYYDANTNPIFYNDPNFFIEDIPVAVTLDMNAHNHVALDLLPGFNFNPKFTAYARVGLEYTSFSWDRHVGFPIESPVPIIHPTPFEVRERQSEAVVNFRFGAGLSYAAGQHLRFNINYIHKIGSRASFSPNILEIVTLTPTQVDSTTTLTAVNTIKPTENELLLGMTVTF